MSGYILRDEKKMITLSEDQVDRLIQLKNSDAALLYLVLKRLTGAILPDELSKQLGWTKTRLDAAESLLINEGIIEGQKRQTEKQSEDRVEYSLDALTELMGSDNQFAMLVRQADEKLGRHLGQDSIQYLANLYDEQGLPADVIYLLINYCVSWYGERYGENRKPTAKTIWKEGCKWVQKGLTDQGSADRYLRSVEEKRGLMGEYMSILGLGNRKPATSEEKYLAEWIEAGYSKELIEYAYNQTMLYKQQLNWAYMNGILKNCKKDGMKSVDDIQQTGKATNVNETASKKKNTNSWMKQYTKKR